MHPFSDYQPPTQPSHSLQLPRPLLSRPPPSQTRLLQSGTRLCIAASVAKTLSVKTHTEIVTIKYRKYVKLKYDRPGACADTDESAILPLPGLAESELTPSAPDTVAAPNCRDVLVRSQSVHMPFSAFQPQLKRNATQHPDCLGQHRPRIQQYAHGLDQSGRHATSKCVCVCVCVCVELQVRSCVRDLIVM